MKKLALAQELAFDLTLRAGHSRFWTAAVIIRDREIISYGWSHAKTHAEIHAIERAGKRPLRGTTIIVACRNRKTQRIHISRPCGNCLEVIMRRKIACIVYSNHKSQTLWNTILLNYE